MASEERRAPGGSYWKDWAKTAEPKACEGCGEEYQPDHPRRRYCHGPNCTVTVTPRRARGGTRPRVQRERNRTPAATARAQAVQGLLSDVVMTVHTTDGVPAAEAERALIASTRAYLLAKRRGDDELARRAAVKASSLLITGVLAAA